MFAATSPLVVFFFLCCVVIGPKDKCEKNLFAVFFGSFARFSRRKFFQNWDSLATTVLLLVDLLRFGINVMKSG